jgi:hypothetical protein
VADPPPKGFVGGRGGGRRQARLARHFRRGLGETGNEACARSTAYTWSLLSGETTLGEASFETLGAEAIQRAEASGAAAKSFSDRILHAFVLQEVGARQDARRAWAELARERPDLPELAVLAR